MVQTIEGSYVLVQEQASAALRSAKIDAAWSEYDNDQVRLRLVPDDDVDLSWLDQDHYSEKYRSEQRQRADQDGCWILVGESLDGEEWIVADSCGGFIGEDWKGSGYDDDIKRSTMDQFEALEICPTCGRPKGDR